MANLDPKIIDLVTLIQDHIDQRVDAVEKSFQTKLDDLENRMSAHIRAESDKREARIKEVIDHQIQTDVSSGLKSKAVAAKNGVHPNYVSKVAPRAKFAPGNNLMQ